MGRAKKWCLLANLYDKTMLRNKLSYDFAAEIGMDYVSSCEFAELYLNGVYRGCYLLTEAVEIGETGVDLLEDGKEVPAGIRAVSRYSNPISFYTPITTCSSASTTPPTPLPRSSGG